MVFFSQARAAAHSRTRASSRVLRAAATAAMRASYSRCTVATLSGLSRGRDVILLPLSGGDGLLLIDRERLEMLFGMISKMVEVRVVVVGGGEP
jgi:hypothetical protein